MLKQCLKNDELRRKFVYFVMFFDFVVCSTFSLYFQFHHHHHPTSVTITFKQIKGKNDEFHENKKGIFIGGIKVVEWSVNYGIVV